VNRIGGYIGSNPRDAALVGDALRNGPVMFSWTDGSTHYDFYMIPSDAFKTAFCAPQTTHRWAEHGQVVVGISRKGCFNFGLMDGQEFMPGYVAEKLGLDQEGSTPEAVSKLFTLISIYLLPKRSITLP
jgi:hypothetical protein